MGIAEPYHGAVSASGTDEPTCADCGAQLIRTFLAATPVCDRCYGTRIAASHGWPTLPEPPDPETIVGPDGRQHRIVYRVWRSPGGIAVEAGEGDRMSDGYFVQMVGPHDGDVTIFIERVKASIRRRIAHKDLERSPTGDHLIIAGDDLTGRLVWCEDGESYGVVVDGRQLSWEEFGRTLEPFEGWEFRLSFRDRLGEDEGLGRSHRDDPAGAPGTTRETRIH